MVRFAWVRMLAQVQKFSSVESDAVGAAIDAVYSLLGKLDVSQKHNADSISGLGRQVTQFAQLGLESAKARSRLLVALQGFLIRIEDENPAVAVDDDQVAAGDIDDKFPQTDNGGNLEGAGHDRGV